ncbi:MAG: type II toxin-antitoxin system VapC family toxin [Anaerolineae bacterium]|nr:type II toxin-antitoxin system VapC family toxin [Anaerolineae bacterium]
MESSGPPLPEAMPVFVDTCVIFAAIYGRAQDPEAHRQPGASLTLLELGRAGVLRLLVSDLVLEEARAVFIRKLPAALPNLDAFLALSVQRVESPGPASVIEAREAVGDPADAPVLAAAAECEARFLVTLNPRHFPTVYGGLAVVTPGELVRRIRRHLTGLEPA